MRGYFRKKGKARNGHFGLLTWNFWYKTGSTTKRFNYIVTSGYLQGRILLLISVICRLCQTSFCVCRCCWRGQAYCSTACRITARRASHRRAQSRYRQTAKGRRAHCLAENNRRQRKNQTGLKNMDDQPSTSVASAYILVSSSAKNPSVSVGGYGYCHFCGRWGVIVTAFARRGYGKTNGKEGGLQ